jgi:PadR family transcriptional regulator
VFPGPVAHAALAQAPFGAGAIRLAAPGAVRSTGRASIDTCSGQPYIGLGVPAAVGAGGAEGGPVANPSDASRKDLFPGALEMMVLETLRREPLHGYALVQRIRQASNDLLQVEEGSLYPALQRMLKAGWVTARWRVSPSGRRIRAYTITPAGERHLAREVSKFEQMLEGIRLVLAPVAR